MCDWATAPHTQVEAEIKPKRWLCPFRLQRDRWESGLITHSWVWRGNTDAERISGEQMLLTELVRDVCKKKICYSRRRVKKKYYWMVLFYTHTKFKKKSNRSRWLRLGKCAWNDPRARRSSDPIPTHCSYGVEKNQSTGKKNQTIVAGKNWPLVKLFSPRRTC